MKRHKLNWILLLLFLCSCCCRQLPQETYDESYYLVLLVNARKLDYSDGRSCLKTTAKHPSDGSKNGDVGHAWILLHSPCREIEGGQSGETGYFQPKYMEGVIDNIELGSENPASYLFCSQCDGFFQQGNGGHRPTFAAKIALTPAQHQQIAQLIATYPYQEYSLTNHQCTTFVKQAAALAGLYLEDQVTIPLPQTLTLNGRRHLFWTDPRYSCLPCGSPDRLEQSLKAAVNAHQAEEVTRWYLLTHPIQRQESYGETLRRCPERLIRWSSI